MIGVAKNQNVIRFDRMSLMSRKCTVSDERMNARPRVSVNCTTRTRGNQASSDSDSGRWKYSRNTARIDRPKPKCTMLASTVTIGSTSAGNITFLIRFPPAISTFADSLSDDENHVQGSSPQKRNTEYGSI